MERNIQLQPGELLVLASDALSRSFCLAFETGRGKAVLDWIHTLVNYSFSNAQEQFSDGVAAARYVHRLEDDDVSMIVVSTEE
jgi:hypothetical protein